MKVLVVGNGAREHAIAWKLRQSPTVTDLKVAPGNAGTGQIAENVGIGAGDIDGLAGYAGANGIDLTVIGPEAPLAEGIVDRFQDAGLTVFGPTGSAARIESSKAFAKDLMLRHNVPTGAAATFETLDQAVEYAGSCDVPVVVKADGLAAGKGVIICQSRDEALAAVRLCMEEKSFGAAGDRVLVEEFLEGQEVSVFAFVDGEYVSPMVAACDYKRVGDGDVGPNTGGMGSYSPPTVWGADMESHARREVMEPVARAMVAEGCPYTGLLYAGLILTRDGPKVLEFNCRLGDPETQVILPRLKSDLAEIMMGTAQGRLDGISIEWTSKACVGVVVASGGYPGSYPTGLPISGLYDIDDDVTIFHAGTAGEEQVVTSGGRVLTVASLGSDLEAARRRVYDNIGRIDFQGAFYRKDIAAGV